MSIRTWGYFELFSPSMGIKEEIGLSFKVVMLAVENQLGLLLGGNVESEIFASDRDKNDSLLFQLTDDPLSNVAECLFIGDDVEVFAGHHRNDIGESLKSRLSRVQRFFTSVLETGSISKIIFHINSGFGEEEEYDIDVQEFVSKMLPFYDAEANRTPTIRLNIT